MQGLALEAICANYVEGPFTEDTLRRVAKTVGRTKEDRPGPDDDLTLGLAVAKDFSHERALERLLAYEGRIEQSLYKAMAELEKLRKGRRAAGATAQNKANSLEDDPTAQNRAIPATEYAYVAPLPCDTEGPVLQNKANPIEDEPAAQNKPNAQATDGFITPLSVAAAEPPVQNKANSAGQEPDVLEQEPAGDSMPLGT
jgi:hypothetical protein